MAGQCWSTTPPEIPRHSQASPAQSLVGSLLLSSRFWCAQCFVYALQVKVLVLTLCYTVDCSLAGSPVHGILQTRILEWVAIPFSRGPSWPRDRTWVSHIAGRYFTVWVPREAFLQYANQQTQNHTSSIWSLYLRRQDSSIFIILGQVPGN